MVKVLHHLALATTVLILTVPRFKDEKRDDCVGLRRSPHRTGATKTPYTFVVNANTTDAVEDLPHGCQVEQIWLISRHGTRYPSEEGVIGIRDRLPEMAAEIKRHLKAGLGALCEETVSNLEDWRPQISMEDKNKLHAAGELEMVAMGERLRTRFPTLMQAKFGPESFTMRSTCSQRTEHSRLSFAKGFFGDTSAEQVNKSESFSADDELVRFYKSCPLWLRDVKLNPDSLREKTLFVESPAFQAVVESLSRRLGYSNVLSLSEVVAVFNGCVFGQAWEPMVPSPWCQVLEEEELEVLEYSEDLEKYWQDGYAYNISGSQACVLVKDLLESFENTTRRGTFYFTHSSAILKFITYLGLHKDKENLRHDNFHRMKSRRWRTSLFNSFSANVAFALASCDSQNRKISLFVNEKATLIPGCEDQVWCDIDRFVKLFRDSMQNCDLKKICAVNDGGRGDNEERFFGVDEEKF